jgi:hypothetical protein
MILPVRLKHNVDISTDQPPPPSCPTIKTITLGLHFLEMLSNLAQCRIGVVPLVGSVFVLCPNGITGRSAITTTGIRAVAAVATTALWRRWWWWWK